MVRKSTNTLQEPLCHPLNHHPFCHCRCLPGDIKAKTPVYLYPPRCLRPETSSNILLKRDNLNTTILHTPRCGVKQIVVDQSR